MKSSRYMDRALRSADPRFARILGNLGHEPTRPKSMRKGKPHPLDHDGDGRKGGAGKPNDPPDMLTALRAEYETALGKKPFYGWDAGELRRRIDEHLAAPAQETPAETPSADDPDEQPALLAPTYGRRDMQAED